MPHVTAQRMTIKGSSDYAVSADSDLVIITAGARQREGESRLDLVGRNLQIFKGIVPLLVRYSPQCTICVVSNPVDIMTYITWRLSGFPLGRVFGSGTSLDSSRFRTLIADRLGVDPRSVHGAIIGEHGDSSVACWSNLNIGGVRLRDINPLVGAAGDPENWADVHHQVVQSAYEIIKGAWTTLLLGRIDCVVLVLPFPWHAVPLAQCSWPLTSPLPSFPVGGAHRVRVACGLCVYCMPAAKGMTNWAIGVCCAAIAEAVLRNELRVMPLSVPIKGRYGIETDVFLSLPCVVGIDGVRDVLSIPLDADEQDKLRASATTIHKVQSALEF
jgi:malate/lactate dehydrogenase